MSRTTHPQTDQPWTLPDHLEPPWRRLPFMAWIAATGLIGPNLGAAQILIAAPGLVLFVLPLLIAARATGQLAAGPRALVLVLHRRHAPATLAVLYLFLTGALSALVVAGASLIPAAWWSWLGPVANIVLVVAGVQVAVVLLVAIGTLLRRRFSPWIGAHLVMVTVSAPATRPPARRRAVARCAYVVKTSRISSRVLTVAPSIRVC